MKARRLLRLPLPLGVALLACTPLHDLDAVSRGDAGGSGGAFAAGGVAKGTFDASGGVFAGGVAGIASSPESGRNAGGTAAVAGSAGGDSGGRRGEPTGGHAGDALSGGEVGTAGGVSGGAPIGGGGTGGSSAGLGGGGGSVGNAGSGADGPAAGSGGTGGDAASLPLDLPNTPVTGTFKVSTEATWEVDGVFVPTFEIHTPSASYWLVQSLGEIVSIVDAAQGQTQGKQWIDFSSGFRPLRGLPSYGTFADAEAMNTTLDEDSRTPTHLRLLSESESGAWRLVWDFYPTHVTLTVNAAPVPYGIAYRGVPGGLLDTGDRFVAANGAEQSAMTSSVVDWGGPAEWAYVTDPALDRSFFAIQHGDDATTDRYQVKDNDSAMISFGDGALTRLPLRFSFGIVPSSSYQAVKARVDFVVGAI
jgi:hypothetical protein